MSHTPHPGSMVTVGSDTTNRPSNASEPHERDLDQPRRVAYLKPWERRRLYWTVAVIAVLVIAATVAIAETNPWMVGSSPTMTGQSVMAE